MKRGSISSSSSSSPSYLRHKALTKFLKHDSSSIRRARSIQSFLASSTPLDQRLFFLDLHPSIFRCCQDSLTQLDATPTPPTSALDSGLTLPFDDVACVFSILSALIEQTPHLLRTGWQLAPLISILQSALSHHHLHQLRSLALSLLLKLIDTLLPNVEPVLLSLLSSAVNLLPFLPPTPSPSSPSPSLSPSPPPPSPPPPSTPTSPTCSCVPDPPTSPGPSTDGPPPPRPTRRSLRSACSTNCWPSAWARKASAPSRPGGSSTRPRCSPCSTRTYGTSSG